MSDIFRNLVQPLRTGTFPKSLFRCREAARPESAIPVERIASEFSSDDEVEITQTRARFIPHHQKRKLALGALLGLTLGIFLARRRKPKPA